MISTWRQRVCSRLWLLRQNLKRPSCWLRGHDWLDEGDACYEGRHIARFDPSCQRWSCPTCEKWFIGVFPLHWRKDQ
jgi:hypothetical protein